jgi:hypothetical protein
MHLWLATHVPNAPHGCFKKIGMAHFQKKTFPITSIDFSSNIVCKQLWFYLHENILLLHARKLHEHHLQQSTSFQ